MGPAVLTLCPKRTLLLPCVKAITLVARPSPFGSLIPLMAPRYSCSPSLHVHMLGLLLFRNLRASFEESNTRWGWRLWLTAVPFSVLLNPCCSLCVPIPCVIMRLGRFSRNTGVVGCPNLSFRGTTGCMLSAGARCGKMPRQQLLKRFLFGAVSGQGTLVRQLTDVASYSLECTPVHVTDEADISKVLRFLLPLTPLTLFATVAARSFVCVSRLQPLTPVLHSACVVDRAFIGVRSCTV
jgi:hypothetical protein